MDLLIASNNRHKAAEIKAILAGRFGCIMTLEEAGIEIDVVEDGDTFAENAVKKAHTVFEAANVEAVLADDSGLMVDALGGAPGVHSARFADMARGHDDAANRRKLLDVMKDVPEDARGARFVTTLALTRRGKEDMLAEGFVEGRILFAPRGHNGFGYDPLFYYGPLQRSFAELSAEEKNEVSHRRRALQTLCVQLEAEE